MVLPGSTLPLFPELTWAELIVVAVTVPTIGAGGIGIGTDVAVRRKEAALMDCCFGVPAPELAQKPRGGGVRLFCTQKLAGQMVNSHACGAASPGLV